MARFGQTRLASLNGSQSREPSWPPASGARIAGVPCPCTDTAVGTDVPRGPAFIEPMGAKLVGELPTGDDWLYEPKLDGYRVLALKNGPHVRLLSRNNKDLTSDFARVRASRGRHQG